MKLLSLVGMLLARGNLAYLTIGNGALSSMSYAKRYMTVMRQATFDPTLL